jgi:type VI secretion system protein ImpH
LEDQVFLHYSGHYAHYPRSAAGLEAILADYLGRPVRVEQFHGRRISLATEEQTALGTTDNPEGRFCQLGGGATIGSRIWDVQGGFRLCVGPLDEAQFHRFMPDGEDLAVLAEMTRRYVGPALRFDVQLRLSKEEVPQCRLAGPGLGASRLGWNSWLKDRTFLHDAADAVFQC